MKKLFVIASFLVFSSAYAGGHLSAKDRIATLECAGLYYANSMIPQGTLELDKIIHSIASKKFLTTFLIKEGVKEDEVNSKLNKSVDELYEKSYDEKKTSSCDKFINKLIPESKKEIEKLVRSGIY